MASSMALIISCRGSTASSTRFDRLMKSPTPITIGVEAWGDISWYEQIPRDGVLSDDEITRYLLKRSVGWKKCTHKT
jgi:hypothetical protein